MIGQERPLRVEPLWEPTVLIELASVLAMVEHDWRSQGQCADADWRLFDPVDEGEQKKPFPPRAVEAARYCVGCPVRERCRRTAEDGHELGVWAGQWRSGTGNKYRVRDIPLALPSPRRRRRAA